MKKRLDAMNVKTLLIAVVCGSLVTLATGLFANTPPMLVGATHYGYPLAWLTRLIIAPQYFPWRVNVLELVLDVVVWSAVSAIVLFIMKRK